MGRQLRSTIPQLPTFLTPRWPNIKRFRETDKWAKDRQQRRYNMRYKTRPLPTLRPGQSVWLQREKSQGTVIHQAETPRSYFIHTDGGLIRRNRTHMQAVHLPLPQKPMETTDTTREQCDTHTHASRDVKVSRDTDASRAPYVTNLGRVSQPPEHLNL